MHEVQVLCTHLGVPGDAQGHASSFTEDVALWYFANARFAMGSPPHPHEPVQRWPVGTISQSESAAHERSYAAASTSTHAAPSPAPVDDDVQAASNANVEKRRT